VTTAVGPRFYHDGIWKTIDPVPVLNSGWYEMTKNKFQVRQNAADASWEWTYRGKTVIGSFVGLGWLNISTKVRQIAAVPQTVTPVQTGNLLTWPGYFGAGLDLVWRYNGIGCKQEIVATQAGRASLGAPPWGAAGTAIVIVERLVLPSGALRYLEGEWDGVNPFETDSVIRLEDDGGILARFSIDKAYNEATPPAQVTLLKRLVLESGHIYLASGQRYPP